MIKINKLKLQKISKILIPLIIIVQIFIFTSGTDALQNKKDVTIVGSIKELLNAYHYAPIEFDDSLSAKSFNLYLKNIDYNKIYLIQSDYDALSTYKYKIDDELLSQTFDFFNLSNEIITKRIEEAKVYYDEILSTPFDYTVNEVFDVDFENKNFVKDKDELKEWWRKNLKHQVLINISTLEKEQNSKKEKNDTVVLKSFDELEKEAREKVRKTYNTRFKYIDQINRQDRFTMYINTIINVYDPHTGYFPPKDKEDFDINISGQLEGIGATLSSRDGYIKVVGIVPGSASWKQGELKVEDIILKVAQENEEAVDVTDMRLDEAVKLIRGPKGTTVILTVKKIDGIIKEIPIVRDVVILEETFARSTIITDKSKSKKIGYIFLPRFYMDFNNKNGRNCSDDVKQEILKLKKENVDGIIFDLRNNGGGSLRDVVKIGGYFISKGPIVQVKQRVGTPEILRDTDQSVIYDGPLTIMINSQSASASEILAAAMQDYDRAVIVGSKNSYGKGTVQRFVDIDMFLPNEYDDIKPIGHMKITIQKFYRINGGATQLKGVVPDVILPDKYSNIEIGEKELDYPMSWSEIPKVEYAKWTKKYDLEKIRKNSLKRQKNDSLLQLIDAVSIKLKEQREKKIIPLEYEMYKDEETKNKQVSRFINRIGKSDTPLDIIEINSVKKVDQDTLQEKRIKDWYNTIKKDAQLYETYNIMLDML